MIKRIFIALTCTASLHASEALMPVTVTTEPNVIVTEVPKTTAESINLIIQDLETAITLMDSPRRALIEENLDTINETTRMLVIKLMALMKINKLADCGVESAQAYALFRTYARFKTKLTQINAETSALEESANQLLL